MEDGTPVDIVLNPLGRSFPYEPRADHETILGWAGNQRLGMKFATPIFDGATVEEMLSIAKTRNCPQWVTPIFTMGRLANVSTQKATVGVIYMIKLHHMVDDKDARTFNRTIQSHYPAAARW